MTLAPSTTDLSKCPRCGYDLRGALANWTDACPLNGTCTECGLHFDWAHVLRPEKFAPAWCVEFVPRWGFPRACVSTFGRSFRPWRFWSALKMSMKIRPRRLLVYMGMLLLPIAAPYATLQTVTALRMRFQVQRYVSDYKRDVQAYVAQLQLDPEPSEGSVFGPDTRTQLAYWQTLANATYAVNHSYGAAVVEPLLFPWRRSSKGTVTVAGQTSPYPAPRALQRELDRRSGTRPLQLRRKAIRTTLGVVLLGLWIWLLLPVSFVLLPVSRRRARVRWAHFLRITAYALVVPSAVVTLSLLALSTGFMINRLRDEMFGLAHLLLRYAMIPLLLAFWAVAIKRYLHIPHNWAVAVLLSIVVVLPLGFAFWFVMEVIVFELASPRW